MSERTPISIKEWSVIAADIAIGNNAMQNTTSSHMIGMAAYHYTQAMEKSLKAIIRANNEDVSQKILETHDFDKLLVMTELASEGFIASHRFIAENSQTLSNANGMRYGNKGMSKGDAFVLMKETKKLFYELQNELCKETGKTTEQLQEIANFQHREESTTLFIDDSSSEYKNKNKHKEHKGRNQNTVERE